MRVYKSDWAAIRKILHEALLLSALPSCQLFVTSEHSSICSIDIWIGVFGCLPVVG